MSIDQDAETRHILDCFRDRLKQIIQVEPLLDQLHFLGQDRKDKIRAKLRADGDISAAALLIDEILQTQHDKGWPRELVTALETAGCTHAVNYVRNSPPEPTEEAENDSCVRLIDLMQLTLVNMKTTDVCAQCWSLGLLTPEDKENVSDQSPGITLSWGELWVHVGRGLSTDGKLQFQQVDKKIHKMR